MTTAARIALGFALFLTARFASAEPTDEVRITGRHEPHAAIEQRFARDEIRTTPGAFGDPFRAIDVTPGFLPVISGFPYFYVRGAPPSAVGYYVDEVRVPYLFHFLLGPGVIQPTLIEEVSVQPAAYAARYGRYAGGIVAARTREPGTELHGEAQVRLFDAGAYVEAPIGQRAVVGVGGRYSYAAALLSLVQPDLSVDYRDYNARATFRIDDHWTATAFTFGTYDYASQMQKGVENVYLASEFHRLDLRLDRRGSDGATTRIAVTTGFDRTRIEGTRFAQDVLANVRARHRFPATKNVDVELGGDLQVDAYHGDLPNPYAVLIEDYRAAQELFSTRVDTASGVWASATHRPARGWDLTATMRADFYTSAGRAEVGPSPRASARVPIVRGETKLTYVGALGVAPQTPAYGINIPAVGFRGLPGGLAYAFQKSSGFELGLARATMLRVTGFHHTYTNMRGWSRDGDFLDPPKAQKSPTQAFGLEVFASTRPVRRLSTFVSATLSRAEVGSTIAEAARASPFDRTYILQVGGLLDLGRSWRVSSRFITYGGWPQGSAPSLDERIPQNQVPTRPPGRLPAFYRVDFRLEKRWAFQSGRWLALVLEGLNVTATKEVLERTCPPASAPPPEQARGCQEDAIGPIAIPSIGVEGGL